MFRLGPAEIVIILGLVAFVAAVVVVLYWIVRRATRPGEGQKGAEDRPLMKREVDLAELDQHGRLLYQLIERQDRAFEEQAAQGRMLGRIASWVTLFGIVWLLGLVLGCVWALLSGVSLLSLLS